MLAYKHCSGKLRSIALACGGTAGHVYPALAIAEAYSRCEDNIRLLFISTPDGFAPRLIPSVGHRLVFVQGGPLFGVGWIGKLHTLQQLTIGIIQARRILKEHGIRLVIGVGGYASAAALCAAKSLGLSTVIHEANAVPGLANAVCGRFAERVYLGFASAAQQFAEKKRVVTGNPVRSSIASLRDRQRRAPRASGQAIRVLVTGGSLGASFLNHHAPELLQRVASYNLPLTVWHQVAEFDPEPVRNHYAKAGIAARVEPYIEDMGEAYRWADFAITRAGAGTLAELAICGTPALLVPLPHAPGDHQVKNAEAFVGTGEGWWVRETEWQTERLAQSLRALLTDAEAWLSASRQARRWAMPDAAQTLVADCEALMAGRW